MLTILAAGMLLTAAPAHAQRAGVFIDADPTRSRDGASGLLVAGRGPDVGRAEALDAIDGVPRCPPCPIAILLPLPEGEHANDRRYLIKIVGPGYEGLLYSDRTRIPGLISIYDIKPTVEALERGDEPPITSRSESDVSGRLNRLDERLDDVDDARTGASFILAGIVAGFALLGLLLGSARFGRASLLAIPVALSVALALSALEVSAPTTVLPVLGIAATVGALALAAVTARRVVFAAALLAIFPIYLFVLAISTETSSLAVIGPRPENGGRFYGFNNQLETLLLVPALLAAVLLGRRAVLPAGLLALIVVGASFAGADGGGLLVYAAGFVFLWMVMRRIPLTARNLAIACAAIIATGLALVGIDAALGGESHVTRSLEGGPNEVLGDIADRLRASASGVVSSWHSAVVVGLGAPILVWLALRRPRYAVIDALLVALAVSLLVNDAPREVVGFGALSAGALRFWRDTAEAVPRRALGAPTMEVRAASPPNRLE